MDEQESRHCVKVLRHKTGDIINVIDGEGSLMECRIVEASKRVSLEVISSKPDFGSHNYCLQMAVCPTKNIDRYEWFLEKSTEIGIDTIVPVIGDHSERKVINSERCERILLSAAKQSLKGRVPVLAECCTVKDFIKGKSEQQSREAAGCGNRGDCSDGGSCSDGCGVGEMKRGYCDKLSGRELKLIAYCGEATKVSVQEAVAAYMKELAELLPSNDQDNDGTGSKVTTGINPRITILIGPEGDFSQGEVDLAIQHGFVPVHLGNSRLRTETAAVVACSWVYSAI